MKKWASIGLAGALAAAGLAGAAAAEEETVVTRLLIESVPQEAAYATSAARGIELHDLIGTPEGGEATEPVPGLAPGNDITGTVPARAPAGEAVASAATAVVPAARPDFRSRNSVTAAPRRGIVRTNGEAGKRRLRLPLPVATGAFR